MKRVLIADDNEGARHAARKVLEMAGHEVIEARDGSEALVLAVEHKPDVAVFDMTMPGMHGHEVCAELHKRTDELATLPVILLTGVEELMGGALAAGAGVQRYLNKPVNPRELIDAINELTS